MADIRIDRYAVPAKLYNELHEVFTALHIDIVDQTGVDEQRAAQLVAQILNRIAFQIHNMNCLPGEMPKDDPKTTH